MTSDGGNDGFSDEWHEKIDTYGAIPKGEKYVREVDVPKKISEKNVVSRFARTMVEAGVTPDETVSEFEKAVLDGKMSHEVITNKKVQEHAKEQIEYLGFKEALNRWTVLFETGKVGKQELVLGMELYNRCITNKDIRNIAGNGVFVPAVRIKTYIRAVFFNTDILIKMW